MAKAIPVDMVSFKLVYVYRQAQGLGKAIDLTLESYIRSLMKCKY